MKKIMKKMVCFLAIGVFAISSSVSAFAQDDIYDAPYLAPEEIIMVSEEYAKSMMEDEDARNYGWMEYSTVIDWTTRTHIVKPSGQPSIGYRGNGSVYVNTGGGVSSPVSFSLGWGPVSISISSGSMLSIGGFVLRLPDATNYYKVEITKGYRFNRVRVDCYQYGVYQYSYNTTHSIWEYDHVRAVKA